MKAINTLIACVALVFVLISSLLIVLLNPGEVELDLFGFFFVTQSIGMLVLLAFVGGIVFSLLLSFIPSQILVWRNKRLKKKASL